MFVSTNHRVSFLRVCTMLCLTAGFFLASGTLHQAMADRSENFNLNKSKTHLVKQRSSKKAKHHKVKQRKVRRRKASTYGHARRALQQPQKQSLRHLAKKHRAIGRTTQRYYGGLHPRLSRLLAMVKNHYGRSPVVSSGCRSHRHNRRVGGAKRSMHLRCMAADFKVAGVSKASLRRYVSTLPGRGGVGTYCGRSIVHLDVGPRRSWYHGCRKRSRSRRS